MSDDRRQALAQRQHALLVALVAGGGVPEGFDVARVRLQATALIAKRRGLVERVRPDLRAAPALGARFAEYAAAHPQPDGGPRADADAYERWLASPTARR